MSDEVRELRARMKELHRRRGDQGRARARAAGRARPPPRHRPADGALRGGRGAGARHVARRARPRRRGHPAHRRARSPSCRPRPRHAACGRSATRRRSAAAACRSWTSSTSTRSSAAPSIGQVAVGTATMQDSIMLHLYASDEQRERYLDAAGGRRAVYPSVGLTEPEVAGSDPTQMQTTAYLDGDEWVINGHKWFTSGASRAAFTTVFAKTEPDAEKHVQFSSIIVPDRHARLPDPAGRADDGPRRRPALRGRLRQRAGAARRTCSATAARAS